MTVICSFCHLYTD